MAQEHIKNLTCQKKLLNFWYVQLSVSPTLTYDTHSTKTAELNLAHTQNIVWYSRHLEHIKLFLQCTFHRLQHLFFSLKRIRNIKATQKYYTVVSLTNHSVILYIFMSAISYKKLEVNKVYQHIITGNFIFTWQGYSLYHQLGFLSARHNTV